MKEERDIPRWQQGLRPGAFGEVWDAMKPSERRRAFVGDLVVAFGGAGLLYWLFS
ncbi:hypothetical protein HFN89_02285 [Rhizobium laguerreae]|nr:hypothetical protein [Rhizobium laguerreae]